MKEIKSKRALDNLLKKNQIVLVFFYANWCQLGKSLFPIIEELEQEYKRYLTFVKIDIEKQKDLKSTYKIVSLPLILIIKEKEIKQRAIGTQSRKSIEKMIKKVIEDKES